MVRKDVYVATRLDAPVQVVLTNALGPIAPEQSILLYTFREVYKTEHTLVFKSHLHSETLAQGESVVDLVLYKYRQPDDHSEESNKTTQLLAMNKNHAHERMERRWLQAYNKSQPYTECYSIGSYLIFTSRDTYTIAADVVEHCKKSNEECLWTIHSLDINASLIDYTYKYKGVNLTRHTSSHKSILLSNNIIATKICDGLYRVKKYSKKQFKKRAVTAYKQYRKAFKNDLGGLLFGLSCECCEFGLTPAKYQMEPELKIELCENIYAFLRTRKKVSWRISAHHAKKLLHKDIPDNLRTLCKKIVRQERESKKKLEKTENVAVHD